jgi:hypothetical protein
MNLPNVRLSSAAFLVLAAAATAQIGWQPSLQAALQAAAQYDQAILIAVGMPGERGSDAVIAAYGDGRVIKISRECICFRVDVGTPQPSLDEREVLQRYLGAAPLEPVTVPHHIMVKPDGKTIVSSAAYQLTAGQLEWLIADGIKKVKPDFRWELGEGARAPEGLRYEGTEKSDQGTKPPPTAEETKAAIDALKKGGAGWVESIELYTVVLRSDSAPAVKFVEAQLRGVGGQFVTGLVLTAIGEVSPVIYSPILVAYLEDRDEKHRLNAARGLAKMAHDKTGKAIKKRIKDEPSAKVRGWLIRAATTTAPADPATGTLVQKALDMKEDPQVRMQAAVAAGTLEDRDKAFALMQKALADKDGTVRAAAAYAMACRRDKALAPALEAALKAEEDGDAKHWLEAARKAVVEEGDLQEFRTFRTKVLGETFGIEREGRGGGAGGAGGGAPGGGAGGGGRPGGGGG